MRRATFSGANVFLSRNLVAPEVYDAVHDALKLNGAHVFLCCDPSRSSPDDFHVISSSDHEKFEILKSKGCNLLGPQCVLSCAKEHRGLPKQGYTCCLAMDGVKILASGFEKDKKAKIEQLVTAMGGILQTKASLDVNFVIVNDVLSAKYKYALDVLKKPIVNLNWLFQCWNEHRVVPQEPFRVLPFTGLTICVTRIPPDERKQIEMLIVQNGGRYSADLTKKCTHLVSDAPVGDKYVVAKRWGHIHVVSRKWVDQSIAKKGCLDEGLYSVDIVAKSSRNMKSLQKEQCYQEISTDTGCLDEGMHGVDIIAKSCHHINSLQKEQCYQEISNVSSQPASRTTIEDLEATLSQNVASSFSNFKVIDNDNSNAPAAEMKDMPNYDCRVAEDSETEDNDLYLSNCRIFLIGFEEKEQSKLVNMIRRGGGTRHMLLSEKLTHIILGAPTDDEKREVRRICAWGVIHVVKSSWLEECDRTKKELSVIPRHVASELLFSKESNCNLLGAKKAAHSTFVSRAPIGSASDDKLSAVELIPENRRGREKFRSGINNISFAEIVTKFEHSGPSYPVDREKKITCRAEPDLGMENVHIGRLSNVFKQKSFCFASSFPMEQRDEVIRWITEGGGVLVGNQRQLIPDFIVERHGLFQSANNFSQSTVVSTHWIRSSLDNGCMLDINSHVLYSPLCCHTPLPGFESLRFCVSQYEEKDRLLFKNLCVVLGAKYSSKLTKKCTHLLCKFTNGPKYEASCNWGIQSVTAEWITECIKQDKMVLPDLFRPRAATAEDREAGLCTVSQYPTQAANMVSGYSSQQLPSQSQVPLNSLKMTTDNPTPYGKRLRILDSNNDSNASKRNKLPEDVGGSNVVPDVADAIEDLLAQSNMIQDSKLPVTSCCDQSIFASDHSSIIGPNHANQDPAYGIPRRFFSRIQNEDHHTPKPVGHAGKTGPFDSFSDTQTDSQVVGYEEDLTGRQKIIDRVRSQNLTLSPDT